MPSIRDFSGGVLNQELQNRDTGNGILFDCKNVLSSWNGELRKRTGTAWLATLPEYQRILPYRLPNGNDIILLLGNNTIKGYEFVSDEEIQPFYIYTGDAPSFPTSGWTGVTTNDGYTISMAAMPSAMTITDQGSAFNAHVGNGYYGEGADWLRLYGSTTPTQGYITIQSENAQTFSSAVLRWTSSYVENIPGYYRGWIEPVIQYSDDGINWISVQTSMSNPLPTGGTEYSSYSRTFSGRTENYVVYKITNVDHVEPHVYWRIFCSGRIPNNQRFTNDRLDLSISDMTYVSNNKTAMSIDTSSSFQINDSTIENVKFAQSDNLMILTNGLDAPYYLSYTSGTMNNGTYVTSLDGSQGKPACVCFYQNRLWFGGFTAFPTRMWGSAFGNFTDFTIPGTVLATSPISVDSVEIKSRIDNVWAGNNALYCLSEDGISMIDSQGGIVATNQIEFKLRNREPTNSMVPTYKDDIMMYLGRDKRKILITDYDLIVQRFKAHNISKNYTDFLLSGVKELHYIPDRHSLIYGLLCNGTWFALLFDMDSNKNSLYPFDTNGEVIDVQPVKYNEQTRLVMVVKRSGICMLETKMFAVDQEIMDFMSEEQQQDYTQKIIGSENKYLDCLVKHNYSQPTTEIVNIPFAPTEEVDVIADGVYLGKKEIIAGVVSPLYAWKRNQDIVYTKTQTPTTSTVLYNQQQEELEDYSISNVDGSIITVAHEETITKRYYGYNYIAYITINPASGYSGTFNRNASADGNITYYTGARYVTVFACAWSNGGQTIYTFRSSPAAGERWIINGQPLDASSTIASMSPAENIYLDSLPAEVGAISYNSSFVANGTVTQILNEIRYSGVIYTGILVNNKKYYRNTSIDTTRTTTEIITEDYNRSSEDDYDSSYNCILLDDPATEVIMGYAYDSYAVLKFVSPYTERKYPKEIAVNFINTGYLEVGNTFDSLKSVLNNLVESVNISNKRILMNGNYTKTLDKQAFETPYVIVRSDKGLPFIITGIDYKVDMSNYQGGV